MKKETEIHEAVWNHITLEIRYTPDESRAFRAAFGAPLAHLEIQSIAPVNVPLPVTGTGYRSHFTAAPLIEEAGGPAVGHLSGQIRPRFSCSQAGSSPAEDLLPRFS